MPEDTIPFDDADAPVTSEPIPGVPGALRLRGLLSPAECRSLIALTETRGYAPKVSKRSGPPIRTNTRLRIDAPPPLRDPIARRLAPTLTAIDVRSVGPDWRLDDTAGFLNERWRFNRYQGAEEFFPHYDSGYEFARERRSLLSLIVYLNDDFTGGETVFFKTDGAAITVRPRTGEALVFFHYGPLSPLHAGRPVSDKGAKYILRTDITFQRPPVTAGEALFPQRRKPIVLLMGRAGAGKSTQAPRVAERLGWDAIDFGARVRAVPEDSDLGQRLAEARAQRSRRQDQAFAPASDGRRRPGGWLPDELCAEILKNALAESSAPGLVIDGYPRRRSQSLTFEAHPWRLLRAIHLRVSEAVLADRLGQRGRPGDDPESLAARAVDWQRDTEPLTEHYAKRGELCVIDGEADTNQVTRSILDGLDAAVHALAEDAFPPELSATLQGFHSNGRRYTTRERSLVYRYQGPAKVDRYLKITPEDDPDLRREHAVLRSALRDRLPCQLPQSLGYWLLGEGAQALLTSVCPGIAAKDWAREAGQKNEERRRLVYALAAGFSRLHSLEPEPDDVLEDLRPRALARRARRRWEAGLVSPRSFTPKYDAAPDAFPDRAAIARELRRLEAAAELVEVPDPVLLHGDPCLPNLMIDPESLELIGMIDVGGFGYGEPAFDLALAAWSVGYNLGPDHRAAFLAAYGPVDQERLDFYAALVRFL